MRPIYCELLASPLVKSKALGIPYCQGETLILTNWHNTVPRWRHGHKRKFMQITNHVSLKKSSSFLVCKPTAFVRKTLGDFVKIIQT